MFRGFGGLGLGSEMGLEIVVSGRRVHDVGFRVFLLNKAMELGVNRFQAMNVIKDGKQCLIVRVSGGDLKAFLDFALTNKPEDALVDEVKHRKYRGEIMPVLDYLHFFQADQLHKGITLMKTMVGNQGKMLRNQDEMLKKQDEMLKKQDEVISEIRGMRGDLKAFIDRRLERIEKDIKLIKAKIGLK